MPHAYYNEHDPYAAAWLENLIADGQIAPGDVDTRSILDVIPADLDGYTQCHFFAGVGIWSRALREAGWPDDRPVWTGSCPCQPFSAAGQGIGFDDERHLWPFWHWLIQQHRPETVFGEQVASSDGLVWADLVQADMEATGYALGFVDTCAAGFRSFHIRQRLYFAAHDLGLAASGVGNGQFSGLEGSRRQRARQERQTFERAVGPSRLGNTSGTASKWNTRGVPSSQAQVSGTGRVNGRHDHGYSDASPIDGIHDTASARPITEREGAEAETRDQARVCGPECGCGFDRLPHPSIGGRNSGPGLRGGGQSGIGGHESADEHSDDRLADGESSDRRLSDGPHRIEDFEFERSRQDLWADPSDGYWRDADWLFSRDGKWRPVRPGSFPLAYAAPARMGRLRAYGNGLDLAQATGFIRAYLERDVGRESIVADSLFEWGG